MQQLDFPMSNLKKSAVLKQQIIKTTKKTIIKPKSKEEELKVQATKEKDKISLEIIKITGELTLLNVKKITLESIKAMLETTAATQKLFTKQLAENASTEIKEKEQEIATTKEEIKKLKEKIKQLEGKKEQLKNKQKQPK